jgi:serine protease AprX
MGRRYSFVVTTMLAITAIILSSFLSFAPAQATSTATLSQPLSQWLATATDEATFETIITFDNYEALSRIDTLGIGAVKLSRLPIAFATLTAAQVREVASWPEVRSLWHNQEQQPILDESVPLIGADKVQRGEGLRTPYTGTGVGVAVIDTGVDSTHPDLPPSKVHSFNVVGDPFNKEAVVVAEGPTIDTYGHGTHVSSTIGGLGTASGGRYLGVAPGSTIYSFKTDAGLFLLDSWILASFDWILAHPEAGIRVSSNSWGCCDGEDYNPDDPVNVATKALYDAGVTVVFAASNSGGPNTLNVYAISPWVVSVAAGTKDLQLADFSSRGRIGGPWDRRAAQRNDTGIYRPTITAPGVDINAAKSSQAVVMAGGTDPENPFYTYASGTSMATPHVAGAIALMLEARPTLKPQNVIDILEGTADNMPDYEIFEVGIGHLDAFEAVQAAEKGKIHFPPPINGRTPQFTLTSSTPFEGTVLSSTWLVRECPDTSGLLNHHTFTVAPNTDAIYAEIEWDDPNQLIYLVLYDPHCQEAGVSAALLDIGAVNHRALIVTSPEAGEWTVAVYGRINIPTQYIGAFSAYDKR